MMSKEEGIKVIIMQAFSLYKNTANLDENDFLLIKKIDECNSIDKLINYINNPDFKEIKKVMLSDEYSKIVQSMDLLDYQKEFILSLNNN